MGLLTGLLPTPQGLPTNITPSQGGLSNFGGRVMDNLPYGGGAAYNLINSIVHGFGGTLGEHGPAPSLAGRLLQYINPGFDQGGQGWFGGGTPNGQLPTTPYTNNPPMYNNGLVPSITGQPQLPTTSETNNPPMYGQGGGPQSPSGLPGPSSSNTAWNAWRSPFSQTYQQATNPGSAIGPYGGGITNPYNPNSRYGTNEHVAGVSPEAGAFMAQVRSRYPL